MEIDRASSPCRQSAIGKIEVIGNQYWITRVTSAFRSQIDEGCEYVLEPLCEPEVVVDLFDADRLAGEDLAEVDLLAAHADAAAGGNGDFLVVEGVVELRQSPIGTG